MVEMALLPVFDESAFLHFVFDGGISKLCVERNPEWMISRVREWMDYMGVILPILFLLFIMEQKEQKNPLYVTKTGGVMVCIMLALGLMDILILALGFGAFFVFFSILVFPLEPGCIILFSDDKVNALFIKTVFFLTKPLKTSKIHCFIT